jgi:hypothetical protein
VVIASAVTALGDYNIGAAGLAAIGMHLLARPISMSSLNELAELERAAERGLSGEAARAGAIVIEPVREGIRVQRGRRSLSREAARALATMVFPVGRLTPPETGNPPGIG